MSYQTPPSRRDSVREVLEALERCRSVVLTTHINADGDGAGSQVALAGWLRALGKEAWVINPTPFPDYLRFLLPEDGWDLEPGTSEARARASQADLAVVLDTGEVSRIGLVRDLIRDRPAVVIDHHPPGPDPLPGITLRDPTACATGELVFDLMSRSGGPWPRESVAGLYVALLADTGSFRFSNTSPQCHRMAAELVERGAEPERLHRRVFGNVPLRKLNLLGAALDHLEVNEEGTVAWMTVPREAYDRLGARADDIEGLVDYPRSIDGVEVGLLFRETAKGATKVSFRSNGEVDVNELARRFGGGGHRKASGALVEAPLLEVRARVVEAVQSVLNGKDYGARG